MSVTLGSLIDKLTTINLKMWNNQEILYKIRRMTFEVFFNKYCKNKDSMKKLWNVLKKTCDLNYQRNVLIDEIDEKNVSIIKKAVNKDDLNNEIQRKYKTY